MTKSESENSNSEEMFAAVRFFCDESKKIHYLSADDIEDFTLNDYSKQPKWVKYGVDENREIIFEPAQVLSVSSEYLLISFIINHYVLLLIILCLTTVFVSNIESLRKNTQRYKFLRMRRSDALHVLAQ